jgi:hypothetical protein
MSVRKRRLAFGLFCAKDGYLIVSIVSLSGWSTWQRSVLMDGWMVPACLLSQEEYVRGCEYVRLKKMVMTEK